MIAIVDYGAGNLRSVELALARLGVHTRVTADPDMLALADGLILPGVGAFSDAMAALGRSGTIPAVLEAVGAGRPLLGICLGMQLLLDGRLIPGEVRRLPGCGLKIPHMGWNSLTPAKPSPLFKGLPEEPYVYFVHSYACKAADPADVLAVTDYGVPFHAAVQRGRILGFQFHPEKSGDVGQKLLANFVEMVRGTA